jgi:CRISPR type III-B/RAMP module RAMP protein Cmr1
MISWLELQKNLVDDHEFIAEIEVKTITFTRLGGYKATPYSLKQNLPTEPAAKSLKGVWRWWARTAIVGAYDGKINYRKANEYLNKILGGTDKDGGISLFRLEVSDIRFPADFSAKLIEISNEIDEFYRKVKDFLINQVSQLLLPHNTQVSVTLNPPDTSVTIEHNKSLSQHKEHVDCVIKQGPLGQYFVKSSLGKRGCMIVINLQIPKLNAYTQIPRVRLLLMKRGDREENNLRKNNIDSKKIMNYIERLKEEMAVLVSEGIKFRILLYGSKDEKNVNFALSSLLLSLILGGIGSMTKRAFGSLKLLSFRFRDDLKIAQEIQRVYHELRDREFVETELRETLEKLCYITIEHARRLFNICKIQGLHGIPIVPSLNNIRIEVVECKSLNLVKIGNAFVKQTWKPNPIAQGRNFHTWILGLPRFQERTGYAIKIKDNHENYEPLRRLSSIGIRCFKTRNKIFVIVYGLLSGDWRKDDLWHIRRIDQRDPEQLVKKISIGNSLQEVFDNAFREVLKRVRER